MKKFNKISIVLLLLLGITFTSCETTDLDLLDDPNNVTLDKADLDRYLVAIQIDFKSYVHQVGDNASELTRIENMFGRIYINNYDAVSTNTPWNLAYQGMFSDMAGAVLLAEPAGANKHLGVINVLKAYTLMTLVDFYGDVPYSEATNPSEFPFPGVDDDAALYAEVINLLDESIGYFASEGDNLTNDFYYDNDFSKWIRLANTLKMSAYLNTRLVDSDAVNKFNAIVNTGNFISSSSDDFQFQYGSANSAANTRHPSYDSDYTSTGAGSYRSNWIMDLMYNSNDPRLRYYFYRQQNCTPGSTNPDGVACAVSIGQLPCSGSAAPSHYTSTMAFCNIPEGYWGRDHGNQEGIPPDNLRRTVSGVYPAAGKFDDDDFTGITLDLGGQGAGITPIVLASWVDFMRAEFALAGNNSSGANAFLQSGLTKSIAKAKSFRSVDPDADSSFEPSAGDISAFINQVGVDFTAANAVGKWNILADQQFVSHYGNGIDSYNFYRRTGYPTTLQFNLEQSSGNVIRSFLYAADEANTNNNVIQKPNGDVQVFWDNNPASPSFPSSN